MIINSSEKGQIVIPSKIRKQLQITAGTRFFVRVLEGEIILTPAKDIDALYGALCTYARPGTTHEEEREGLYLAVGKAHE